MSLLINETSLSPLSENHDKFVGVGLNPLQVYMC